MGWLRSIPLGLALIALAASPAASPAETRDGDADPRGRAAVLSDSSDRSCLRAIASDGLRYDRWEDQYCDSFRDTPHFRIHYATTGTHMVYNWPSTAYLDSLAVDLEWSYHRCHDELGMPMVPSDGTRGGGEDLCDCYLIRIAFNADGYASWEGADAPECPRGLTGHIVLRNTYNGPDYGIFLAGSASHEYFHLIQYGSGAGDTWFCESTATWAESVVWPGSVQYAWRELYWFLTPYVCLWDPGSSLLNYGAAHFWVFLESVTDTTFVRDVVNRCCEAGTFDALKAELEERGTSLDDALARFALWNNATGHWNDGQHYPRGGAFPDISCQATHPDLPVDGERLPDPVLAREGGSNYIRFLGPGKTDTLLVDFDGDPELGDRRRISVAAQTRSLPQREWTLAPDQNGDAHFAIPGWGQTDRVTLIVTNLEGATDHRGFRYSARESGPATPFRVATLTVYPNPSRGSLHVAWRTQGTARSGRFEIFDAAGRLIRTQELTLDRPGGHLAEWDAREWRGEGLASGVYLLRLRLGPETTLTRWVLTR